MGASKKALLKLYTALVKSRISYGSEIFYSAHKSALSKLDLIQHRCLTIACGTLKATQQTALQNETGQMPLALERQKILFKHLARAHFAQTNPASDVTIDHWQNHYGRFKYGTVLSQAKEALEVISTLNTFYSLPNTPYWQLQLPHIDTFLTSIIHKKII